MTLAAFISAGVGYVAGLLAAFYLSRPLVRAAMRDPDFGPEQRRTVAKIAAAGGFVALVPALLLGVVVGGTLGGVAGLHGIAAGTFAVVAAIMWTSVALGAWLGRSVARDAA